MTRQHPTRIDILDAFLRHPEAAAHQITAHADQEENR